MLCPDENTKGLPTILGYRKSRNYGEILMAHGGSSLKQWMTHIKDPRERTNFA